jgi:hypothetical protein
MWLFSKSGFFSVVKHLYKPDHLLVRARLQEDIEAMAALLTKETGQAFTPIVLDEADYRYRLEVPRADFGRIMTRLVEDLDYPNFKSAVRGNMQRDQAYGRVWHVMACLQENNVRGH